MPKPGSKLWPLGLYRVEGTSMRPNYYEGDIVIARRWGRPNPNSVIVARMDRILIKRLTKIDADGYWLEGDNAAASTDSRSFGYLPHESIEATVLARLPRAR